MPITTITTDIEFLARFRGVDEQGNAVQTTKVPGTLDALTPLFAMELYERLHAERNKVRGAAGLPEIPTPDEWFLAIGFLKGVKELYDRGEQPNLVDFANYFAELVKQVQIARLEQVTEPIYQRDPPSLPNVRCPACKVRPGAADFSITQESDGSYTTCKACGLTHLTYLWDAEGLWKPAPPRSADAMNSQEPAEVT